MSIQGRPHHPCLLQSRHRLLLRVSLLWLGLMSGLISVTAAACTPPRGILVLGDSLSAAYGIDETQGWVALLRERLGDRQIPREVVNASVSGETSGGGTARLQPLLEKYQPEVVILELGGNDGLRGYPVTTLRTQLQKAIDLSHQHGAKVLLVGMRIPPNYGSRYSHMFSESYPSLARKNGVALVPFLLDGIAGDPKLMQSDSIHPTAAAQAKMLENVWPTLRQLLQSLPSADCAQG